MRPTAVSWVSAAVFSLAVLVSGGPPPSGVELAPATVTGPSVVFCLDGSEHVPALYEREDDGSQVEITAESCRLWPASCLDGSVFEAPSLMNGLVGRCVPRWSRDWDRRADCETGDRYDLDHNGTYESIKAGSANWSQHGRVYSGGLQMDATFWAAYGGLRFAPAPYLASIVEQKTVAERGLKVQHDGAWPWCSKHGY